MAKTEKVAAFIEPELKEAVRALMERDSRTESAVIRLALRAYVSARTEQEQAA